MPVKVTTLLAALAVLAMPTHSQYLYPPTTRSEFWAHQLNVDSGVSYIDVNEDALVDVVQAWGRWLIRSTLWCH